VLNALVPVFAVIVLGLFLRRAGFPGDGFWAQAERMTYVLLFPALLVNTLSRADFADAATLPMALGLMAAPALTGAAMLALRGRMGLDGPAFSSVFQGGVRINTYVGLALAAALYGPRGLALAAVAMVAMIPVLNLMCVPVLARLGGGANGRGRRLLLELAKNPLILGCAAGFALNLSGLRLPASLHETLAVVGRAALPMGLLAVGAGLRPRALGGALGPVLWASGAKLVLMPLAAAALCALLGARGPALGVAVLFAALPTASSSYILARQLGGDAELMATILTAQTVLAALTLPLVAALAA
jgi:predicted permease